MNVAHGLSIAIVYTRLLSDHRWLRGSSAGPPICQIPRNKLRRRGGSFIAVSVGRASRCHWAQMLLSVAQSHRVVSTHALLCIALRDMTRTRDSKVLTAVEDGDARVRQEPVVACMQERFSEDQDRACRTAVGLHGVLHLAFPRTASNIWRPRVRATVVEMRFV